jgi:hypothetical protein
MQRLTLEQLKPSFVLAKPAVDAKGRTLIAEGTQLTDQMIDQLRRREVTSVAVVGAPVVVEGANAPMTIEERAAHLDRAFAPHCGDLFMMRMREAFFEQLDRKKKRDLERLKMEAGILKTAVDKDMSESPEP